MTTPSTFLVSNRRLTQAYICDSPVEVVLTPMVRTRTSAGGYVVAPGPLRDPQTFRVVESTSLVQTDLLRTDTGFRRLKRFTLLCPYDAVANVDDTFTYDGANWKVTAVLAHNGYEIRLEVERYGV